MAAFDIRTDAPGLLRVESLNITLTFTRTGPNTGRISWNIPTPASGCTAADQAYCGIVVTLDNTPISGSKIPVNGTVYSSDPTGDPNLFAGDKLDTARIIGAFYQDRTTTYFDVTGLQPDTPYYVSGFPCDCEYRYYYEGVHAYSLDYTNRGSADSSGFQLILLNSNQTTPGVNPNDYTGLMPGINYSFDLQLGLVPNPNIPVNPRLCHPTPKHYTVNIQGTNSATYFDLVNEINKNLALIDGSIQGPLAPNTGVYYWNATTHSLYTWDGSHNVSTPVIVQATAPDILTVGTYWFNTTTNVLQIWSGTAWNLVSVINSATNPLVQHSDTSYWFTGTQGYVWNGTTWCQELTYIQTLDPSTVAPTTEGAFWYNPTTELFYRWDNTLGIWTTVAEIASAVNPSSLPNGYYWFNSTNNSLYQWNLPNPGWNLQSNVYLGETAPGTPGHGKYWYNPASKVLQQYSAITLTWTMLPSITYGSDPTIRHSCDVWFNTSFNTIWVWDTVASIWVQATTFYNQTTDPSVLPTIADGTLWFNTINNQLYVWRNNCFNQVSYIDYPNDPTSQLINGTVWHNTTTNVFSVFTSPSTWTPITPIDSASDPHSLPLGAFWFNTNSNSLQSWNGVSWVSVLFTTNNPTPTTGTTWFNSTTNTLMIWNGVSWIVSPVKVTVQLDCNGNMLFTDTSTGSYSFVQVTDITLFQSLSVPFSYDYATPGTDGASNQPSYNEIGIGTDGSNDERLLLMNEIRFELGYPVIDVELTNEQLDYAITKALNELRSRSGLGYKRGYFFMQVNPETQRYTLTNKIQGMNKIVDILGIYRLSSSFLSSAHGAGVYGQIVLQHLYNMGTFDLLSYHIMTEYTKTMEVLFAARLTFTWNEQNRELWIHHRFPLTEPMVSIEATVERTEQDIISDRYARPWIRKWATAVSRLMLAEIRGKYSTLPGAGGNITLNAAELRAAAKEEMDACIMDIETYVADKPEEFGMATTFIFG